MAVDTQTYISQCFPSAQRQESPTIVSGRNIRHAAPRVKEGLVPYGQVAQPTYQVTMACVPNGQRPPRFQKLKQNMALAMPLMDTSLHHSPFPKQLGIPALPSNQEPVRPFPPPLLSHDNAQSLEPISDIKSPLCAQDIQIDIPPPSYNPEPPTDQHRLPIDKNINHPSVQMPSLKHSQKPPTLEASNTTVENASPSASGKNEMCRKWYNRKCFNKQCHYAHKIIPSNLTCYLWLNGRCTRLQCPFVHERQNDDSLVKNRPSNSGDTQGMYRADSIRLVPPVTSSVEFSATKAPYPEVECSSTRSLPSVALPKVTPMPKATDKPQLASPVTSCSVGSPATKAHHPGAECHSAGSPPSVASTNVTHVSAGNKKTEKLPSVSSHTPSSAVSSVIKVQKVESRHTKRSYSATSTNTTAGSAADKAQPASSSGSKLEKSDMKPRGTGRPSRVASANTTLIPAIDRLGPPSSIASRSTVSSATRVKQYQVKPHDSGKPLPVTTTDPKPWSDGRKSPSHSNASRSQEVCFDWLQNRCTQSPCSYPHARPSNDHVSETTRRNEDFAIAVTIADHIKVKLRDGFEVQDVTTGFESRWVHIGDLPPHTREPKIRTLLETFGQLDKLIVPMGRDGKLTIKAQYSTAAQALSASMDLHGRQFQGKKLSAKLPLNTIANGTTVLQDTSVRLTWRASQRLGYAGYATLDEAKAVITAATGFVVKDHALSAALYEGLPAVGAYNVMFFHLPADATRKDLEQFGNAESIMLERPNYQAPESGCEAVHKQLRSCGNLSNFDVPLPIRNGTVSAWATFESHADASNARNQLDGQYPRVMGGKIHIAARHVQTLIFKLPLAKYKMLQGDISRLRLSWKSRLYDVTLSDRSLSPDGPVIIRISAENVSNLGVAKAEFEQLQHGEVVTFEKKPIWDRFFSHLTGQSFLRELESQYPGIEVQTRMGKILLLGPIAQRQLARRDIMKQFQALQARQRWYIPLSGKVVGAFVSKDLMTLQQSVGAENCQILLSHEHTLLIRGNEQTYRIACEVVEKVQNRHAHRPAASGQSLCPVCFSEPSVPARLTCGHSWCTSCLERYLVTAVENKTFPLTCLGNDASCTQRISLLHAKKILSGDDYTALCEASFFSYVHARTMEFHHCPTPDCAQVYRATIGGAILQCPSCLVRICSMCHMKAHDGFSCEEREAAEDKLFYEWAATHDVKNCPGCKTPIERSEGCNHMTCTRCQTHICWECLATFPKGDGIYQHMRYEHGGIGLETAT